MSTAANRNPQTKDVLLRVEGVSKVFQSSEAQTIRFGRNGVRIERPPGALAVDTVDLVLQQGEVLGLVGESGCGKSTLGRIAAGIMAPTSGRILWDGLDAYGHGQGHERRRRALDYQMVFQDPSASLNPRMKMGPLVREALLMHPERRQGDLEAYVAELLDRVGLTPQQINRYPHQFSGGQRQRIAIARALSVNPRLLICDEATASLDVSIQAQILNLLSDLRHGLGLTYLFISHNMGVVEHFCDRVAVMYLGRIVEEAPTAELFEAPNHPYTKALLAEVPRLSSRKRQFVSIKGELPSPLHPPQGCHFHPRCPLATERCRSERPVLKTIGNRHLSACHLNG